MNRIIVQLRIFCLCLCLLPAFAANALILTPLIEAPEGHRLINHQPLLFDNQIIFLTKHDTDYSLWSYDLVNHDYTSLKVFDQFNPNQTFHIIDENFYFRDFNEPSRIWRSDGTPAGTNPVPGITTFRGNPLQPQNNFLFAQGGDDQNLDILGFDGERYRGYGVQHFGYEEKVCAFSLDDVIIPSTNVYAANDHYLIRYTNQGVTNYTSFLPEDFAFYGTQVWQFENTCFYSITAPDFYDVLVIPEVGEQFFLGARIGFSEITEVIRFKNNFYAIGTDAEGLNQLVKLSSDLSQIKKRAQSQQYLNFVSLTMSRDYLIASEQSGGNVSPTVWATNYYDENLNLIEDLGGPIEPLPEIYPTAVGETIYYSRYDYSEGRSKKIIATDIDDLENGFQINGQVLEHVITNVNNPDTYTLMRDLTSGIYTIHHLKQLPDMGSLSVGAWFDPDYQSQGINIVDGVRDDGSRYLFVTLYLFRDGQPLWLSGVGEISYPQPTIDIELGEYSGLGLWQADTAANVEKFADMTLSMSGCHQMMMHLETVDNQTFNIELQRMANSEINLRCKD